MNVEVGQDAMGEWAWMVRREDGRAMMSADGFASEESARANAERTLIDFALFVMQRRNDPPPVPLAGPDETAPR